MPDAGSTVAFLVPFGLILYLALNNGGYGIEERSAAGIVVWFGIAFATVLGLVSVRAFSRSALTAFLLLAAFGLWTGLSFMWTENDERTAIEVARITSFLGFFSLAVFLQARDHGRQVVAGTTLALTVVCALALGSRLHPTWFPERLSAQYLAVPEIERRLAYPLNYAGGVVTLASMTLPLLAAQVWGARSAAVRALAAAAIPLVVITMWLTSSGLLFVLSTVGLLTYLLFASGRLEKIVALTAALAGGAVLCLQVESLDALDRGLPTPEALAQGNQFLLYVLFAMLIVGLATAGLQAVLGRRSRTERAINLSTGQRRVVGGLLAVALITLTAVLVVRFDLIDRGIDRFQSRANVPADASRIQQVTDIGSSGRYQQWQSALDAHQSEPLTGIGAGTFEFWWSRNGLYGGYVRDAHSLYMEALGELGLPGLFLIGAFVLSVLAMSAVRVLKAPPDERTIRAGGLGACAAFAFAAGIDWMWELSVLPAAFLLIAGANLSPWKPGVGSAAASAPSTLRRIIPRVGVGLGGLAAIAIIWMPLASSLELGSSQRAFNEGNLQGAYDAAKRAEGLEPFAAGPRLQQALVLERAGLIKEAVGAAQASVERAPTDWRPRLILARLQAIDGQTDLAVQSYREARELNPYSLIFQR
ncbi:MAG TPA: O-antigen ligase family protein [Solirubrobacterales bacterium]|nr:O-antigen ligase family protein [Solirubrobacterales bacterium]